MTRRNTMLMIITITFFLGTINIQAIWIFDITEIRINETNFTETDTRSTCSVIDTFYSSHVWPWIDFCIYCAFPVLTISICNIAIILRLVIKKLMSSSHQYKSLQITLLAIPVVYLMCTLPITLFGFNLFKSVMTKMISGNITYYQLALIFYYINHAINFYLYCLGGKTFRKELRSLLCKSSVQPVSHENGTELQTF